MLASFGSEGPAIFASLNIPPLAFETLGYLFLGSVADKVHWLCFRFATSICTDSRRPISMGLENPKRLGPNPSSDLPQ